MAKSDKPETQPEVGADAPGQKVKDQTAAFADGPREPDDPALGAKGERPETTDAGTDPDSGSSVQTDLPEPQQPEELPENPWKTSPETAEADTNDAAQDGTLADDAVTDMKPESSAKTPQDGMETATREEDAGDRTEEVAEPATHDAQDTPPVAAAPRTPEPSPKRGGFFPLVVGGAIAAVLGFVAARGEWIDPYLPEESLRPAMDIAPLQDRLEAQAAENDALTARVAELSATLEEVAGATPAPAEMPEEVSSELATLSGRIEALETLQARIDALEARPLAEAPPSDIATTADVAGLQAALDAQRAELAALAEQARAAEENAQSEAQKVLAQAALTRLATAVDSGEPFEPALTALEEVAPVAVPDALQAAAAEGVASLSELQASFPEAARAALAAVRTETPDAEAPGFGDFIKRQLGARSIVPREGDDADAVLSRAEAAMRRGALDAALTELETLPDSGRAAMQGWLDSAAARNAVRQAAAGLENSLNSN